MKIPVQVKPAAWGAVGGAVAAVPLCVAKGRAAAGGAHPLEEGEFLLTQGGAAVLPSPTFLYCIKKEGTPAPLVEAELRDACGTGARLVYTRKAQSDRPRNTRRHRLYDIFIGVGSDRARNFIGAGLFMRIS